MTQADNSTINLHFYSVHYEWMPEDLPNPAQMDEEDREDYEQEVNEPCPDCGITHGVWDSDRITVAVKGDAINAADLVQIWVMGDKFSHGKAQSVRILAVTCTGEAQLTPKDVGMPE
jgi:hypothetical protein